MSKNKFYCDSITKKYDYLNKEQNIADYVRYNINRAMAMFHYEGLPDSVPQIVLEKQLIMNGYTVWAEHNGTVYVFEAGLGGEQDVYYMPTIATVTNPALQLSKNYRIDEDCVVMANDSMYMGLLPLLNKYCTLITENDISMLLADVNKRVTFLLSATDDNTAESARLFLKQLYDGKQGVITDNMIMSGLQVAKTADANTSIMDLVEYEQYLKASMYNEIGLNSNFNMKRERLTAGEVEMNSGNLYPLVDDMLHNRRVALEKINNMFGLNITVDFASSWTMRAYSTEDNTVTEGVEDANTEDVEDTTEGVEDVEDTTEGVEDANTEDVEDTTEDDDEQEVKDDEAV